ncbi:hypothetical protein C8J56DRAFT_1050881 [Mycena floridula]|nr:hypothetical protein C8J56DRAFT_1050881 [Mycena floridula]
MTNFGVIGVEKPKSWRLIEKKSNEEVVLRFCGILASKHLPPIQNQVRLPIKASQSIAITGLDSKQFENTIMCISEICEHFDRSFPDNAMARWMPNKLDNSNYDLVQVSNRYFTKKQDANPEDKIPISTEIDPHNYLTRAAGQELVHTADNIVDYFQIHEKELTDNIEIEYMALNPIQFRVGDVVEVQMSFAAIPNGKDKYRILLLLRGLTLLDSSISKQFQSTMAALKPVTTLVRKRAGYDEEDKSRKKVTTGGQ